MKNYSQVKPELNAKLGHTFPNFKNKSGYIALLVAFIVIFSIAIKRSADLVNVPLNRLETANAYILANIAQAKSDNDAMLEILPRTGASFDEVGLHRQNFDEKVAEIKIYKEADFKKMFEKFAQSEHEKIDDDDDELDAYRKLGIIEQESPETVEKPRYSAFLAEAVASYAKAGMVQSDKLKRNTHQLLTGVRDLADKMEKEQARIEAHMRLENERKRALELEQAKQRLEMEKAKASEREQKSAPLANDNDVTPEIPGSSFDALGIQQQSQPKPALAPVAKKPAPAQKPMPKYVPVPIKSKSNDMPDW